LLPYVISSSLIAALLLIMSTTVDSATFVIYDAHSTAYPQPPPLVLLDPQSPNVNVVLGPNNTWANVTVKATTAYTEITKNGGFDTSPNGWLYGYAVYSGNSVIAAYWNQTYSYLAPGATGVVLLYMRLYGTGFFNRVNSSVYLVQNVTMPNTPLGSIELNVTYFSNYTTASIASLTSYSVFAELIASNGSVVWGGSITVTTTLNSWNNATFTIPTTSVVPGETYTLLVGANAYGVTINLPWSSYISNITVLQFFDSIRLYVKPLYPAFSGAILAINVTSGTYDVGVSVESLNVVGAGSSNVTLYVANLSGGVSSPINVTSNTLVSGSTSSVIMTVPPPGYSSGLVHLSTAIYSTNIVNILLKLRYSVGGVTVTYPVNLTIIDPPAKQASPPHSARSHQHGTTEHVNRDEGLIVRLLLSGKMQKLGLIRLQRWRG